MEFISKLMAYISANWYGILMAGSIILAAAEFIVRLTPTKSDDGFVQRIANGYNKIFELLKVPNIRREDGKLIVPSGVHPPKKEKLTATLGKK